LVFVQKFKFPWQCKCNNFTPPFSIMTPASSKTHNILQKCLLSFIFISFIAAQKPTKSFKRSVVEWWWFLQHLHQMMNFRLVLITIVGYYSHFGPLTNMYPDAYSL
jgi:hypothetical protein